jgi:16S rRNA (cytosine967-C5)-methyltransferase
MIAPARVAAYEVLSAISGGRADLPSAIAHARHTLTDDRDRHLMAEIATGVQRWRALLDHLIVHYARRPIERIDPPVLEILRLSVYQLAYLSRVPASAVVDDAVKLTGRVRKKSAGGLVNAVLRTMSRSRRSWPVPPRPAESGTREQQMAYLTVALSHPAWLAERWLERLGFERAEAWMTFNNHPAPLTIRTNTLRMATPEFRERLQHAGVETHAGQYAPDALIVDEGQPLRDRSLDGLFVVQDESSQLVALPAGVSPPTPLLDVCAAPGGKTTALAAAVHHPALVVACDVRERRMTLLRQTIAATGAGDVRLVQADAVRGLPFGSAFATVIVDAPCSGLGTLRRDPDIRWRRQPADLVALAAAQRSLVQQAAATLLPGGRLIYATCSSEPEENETVAATLAHGPSEVAAVDAREMHPALAPVVDAHGHLRTEPDRHGLEAFFGAVFERARKL